MSAARPQPESSTVSRVLAGTTLALKVAREATDSVSIAKQILGSAAHISEFAEKIEKNRKAMNDLIAKSAGYACHIDTIVAGRIVEGKTLSNLRRLCSVFARIEALVAEAAAVKNGVKRRFHNIFTVPNKASELSSELDKEMELFKLAMMLDVRLAISETAEETQRAIQENNLHDSDGFRRLRPVDVEKLKDIPTDWWQEYNSVTFAKARVDDKLMVIRHPQKSTSSLPSDWVSHLDILKEASYPRTQHANIITLYGQGVGKPDNAFVAFRSGHHKFSTYVMKNTANMSPQLKTMKAFEMAIQLLDACRHMERVLDIVWGCRGNGIFAVDDTCNPTIGLFDEFRRKSESRGSTRVWDIQWAVYFWLTTETYQFGVVQDHQVARALASESNVPDEIAQILQRLQDVTLHAYGSSQSIPLDYDRPSRDFAAATVTHAREYLLSLPQNSDSNMNLRHFQPRALILGSRQCESIWTFKYFASNFNLERDMRWRFSDGLHLDRCWIENGSRRHEHVRFFLDEALAMECRAILGYRDLDDCASFDYRSDLGWLKRPRQRQK